MSRITHTTPRLLGIEALRGFAALGIVAWHQLGFSVTQPLLGHAFKGVGLFFIISGFVLSFGYEARLKNGLSPWDFSVLRVRRLYPLYLTGTLLGFVLAVAGLGLPHFEPLDAVRALPAAVGLWPGGLSSQNDLFPLDAPAWSLYFEIAAGLAYAFMLPVLSNRVLVLSAAAGFLMMQADLVRFGTLDGGWNHASFVVGFARVVYGFPMGVLLQRLWRAGRLHTRALPISWICAIFVAVIAAPAWSPLNPVIEVLISGLLWPVLVILAANARLAPWEAKFARGLGEPSFALYVLHFPVLVAFHRLVGPAGTPRAWAAGLMSLGLVWSMAVAATRWIDVPVRRALAARRPIPAPLPSPSGLAGA